MIPTPIETLLARKLRIQRVLEMSVRQLSEQRFQKLQNYVDANGGQLLSGKNTVDGKVEIICARGHKFSLNKQFTPNQKSNVVLASALPRRANIKAKVDQRHRLIAIKRYLKKAASGLMGNT